ncbi:MAG: metal ABC transporter permease [bacterium]
MMNIITLFQYGFIQRAFITGIFVALLCSTLGLFLVLRRLSLIGDGLSHVSFGAIAIGLFLGIYPLFVAIPLVILSSLAILRLTEKAKVYGDAAIGILSSVALAVGVILASTSHGFTVDLFSYLFGNILAISSFEMIISIVLSLVVLFILYLFYYDLVSLSFNEQLAQIGGVSTKKINILLVILTAITVVLSVRVVGIMLISSLLILPSVTALQIARSFRGALLLSSLSAVTALLLGVVVSFIVNIPTGATVVLINFLFFLLALTHNSLIPLMKK